jgi:hypothetical protein
MRCARLASMVGVSFGAAGVGCLVPAAAFAATGSASPAFLASGTQATFRIACTGSPEAATLSGTNIGLPSDIEMAKTGPGHFALAVRVPQRTLPGPYDVTMECSNGDFGTVTIQVSPRGAANTGDGSSSGTDMTPAIVGGGAIALAAIGGAIVLGRRQDLDPSD